MFKWVIPSFDRLNSLRLKTYLKDGARTESNVANLFSMTSSLIFLIYNIHYKPFFKNLKLRL